MPLTDLTAKAHPCGHRIDIGWRNPDDARYPGMRIVRRASHFPLTPTPVTSKDGDIVLDDDAPAFTLNEKGERCYSHADEDGLHGETTYYYALFPFHPDTPGDFVQDEQNRVAALATSSYGIADQLYRLLPQIYHRYDQALAASPPDGLAPEDREKGPLRRLLAVVGSHFDLIQSHAKAVQDLHDVSRLDGRLLPLLADWIGWRTNYRLGFDRQRRELRYAPGIYETVGIVPTAEATVKRLLGWESRTKSFADNVFLTNSPERLNLILQRRGVDGAWLAPADSVDVDEVERRIPGANGQPFSLNSAYEGRASAVVDEQQRVWLFYHTLRKRAQVTTSVQGVPDTTTSRYGRWDIWYKRFEDGAWRPSQAFTDDTALDRHPNAVLHSGGLWLFWDRWDEQNRHWRLMVATNQAGTWTAPEPLWAALLGSDDDDRKHPVAINDDAGGLWLFWLRRTGGLWRIEYNRHDGVNWVRLADNPGVLPHAGPGERVSDGPFSVLFHPTDAARRLWLFWQRRDEVGGGQHRRRIAWRTKPTLDPDAADWSATADLPVVEPVADDLEPAALLRADSNVELFWCSNRDRSFSVWHDTLDLVTTTWAEAQSVTTNPFSQRGPSVIGVGDETWLFYASNESIFYQSEAYRATTTLDTRYAGSTTLHATNAAKLAFLSKVDEETGERRGGDYQDFNTYTFDTGEDGERMNRHWYARDTVGLYLTPTSDDPSVIVSDRRRIEDVLKQFLPIQLRTVFIIEPPAYAERVYTDDFPDDEVQRTIGEMAYDSTLPETYAGASDAYEDIAPGWMWMYSWSEMTPHHRTVDFATLPINTAARTWHIAVTPGDGI